MLRPAASSPLAAGALSSGTPFKTPPPKSSIAQRPSKSNWTAEEDALLTQVVRKYQAKHWKAIASHFTNPTRTPTQCHHRWRKVVNPDRRQGPFTAEEDELLAALVTEHGFKWSKIAKRMQGRIAQQARDRWHSHLDPEIRARLWTAEENARMRELHREHGNDWEALAKALGSARSASAVKSHWTSTLKDNNSTAALPSAPLSPSSSSSASSGRPSAKPSQHKRTSEPPSTPTLAKTSRAASPAGFEVSPARVRRDDDSFYTDLPAEHWLSPVPMPCFSPGAVIACMSSDRSPVLRRDIERCDGGGGGGGDDDSPKARRKELRGLSSRKALVMDTEGV